VKRLALWVLWVAHRLTRLADWLDPQAAAKKEKDLADTVTLCLFDWQGTLKHEIAIHHVGEAPDEYSYGGTRWRQRKAIGDRVWEYRPVVRG
jgi:hypothetical protein